VNPYLPPLSDRSFGTVVVDGTGQKVLLREPANHHCGYVWTFAKGGSGKDEGPGETAARESREEYGLAVELLRPIPRWFSGREWANFFFLARAGDAIPGGFHWETQAVRWFSWEEAEAAIALTTVSHRRNRDLEILAAARSVQEGGSIADPNPLWDTGSLEFRLVPPASGGYLETDMEDFWRGLSAAASGNLTLSDLDDQARDLGYPKALGDRILFQAFFLASASVIARLPEPHTPKKCLNPAPPKSALLHIERGLARAGINHICLVDRDTPVPMLAKHPWKTMRWCQLLARHVPEWVRASDGQAMADRALRLARSL